MRNDFLMYAINTRAQKWNEALQKMTRQEKGGEERETDMPDMGDDE